LGFDFLIVYSGRLGGFSMKKMFFFCLFVAAVPWTQAEARGGHAVVMASSGHSATVSGAASTHVDAASTHVASPTIVQVPQVNISSLKASAFSDKTRALALHDPLNNSLLMNSPSQQMSSLPAPEPSAAPMNPMNPMTPMSTMGTMSPSVQTQTTTAVNGYTVSQVRQVQSALHRLGYYHGPVDGDFGLGTQTALESYQIHSGTPVTGSLTLGVLSGLGVNGSR
jgi:Putative peptidoglycan binding domain